MTTDKNVPQTIFTTFWVRIPSNRIVPRPPAPTVEAIVAIPIVDIIEIEKSKTELKLKVTLSSSDITDDIVLNLSDKILDKNGKLYTFICSKNIDSLVKELADYKIDELLIEKENLEDAFLNYYENNKEEV